MSSLGDLARRIRTLEAQVRASNRPRLANSTIEDGALRERDRDGNLRGQFGLQFDGTHAPLSLGGPVPPTPSPPVLTSVMGGVRIDWDGYFEGDTIVPMDFARVEVHVSSDQEMLADTADTLVGTIETPRGAGVVLPVATTSPAQYARLVCRSLSGGLSSASVVAGPVSALLVAVTDIGASVTELTTAPLVWGADPPNVPAAGQLWLNTTDFTLWRWNGVEWISETVAEAVEAAMAAMAQDDVGRAGQHPALVAANSIVAQTIIADLIKANQIQARHLEAVLILATTIIAGEPLGSHVSIQGDGVRVYSVDPDEGQYEASRWGTGMDDFWAITTALGVAVASISSSGAASFAALSSVSWPTIGAADWTGVGGSLDAILDRRSRGLVVEVRMTVDGPTTTTAIGWREFGVTLHPGRSYRLAGVVPMKSTVAADVAQVQVRYTTAVAGAVPADPLVGSALLLRASSEVNAVARRVPVESVFSLADLALTVESEVRMLVCYSRVSGTGSVSADVSSDEPAVLALEDIGPAPRSVTTTVNDGSGGVVTPPPTLQNLTVVGSWTNAYTGSGSQPGVSAAWQGHTNATGMRKSMIGFPELTQLVGATIQSVSLRLNATQWSLSSGGTGIVGFHTYLAPPSGSLIESPSYTTDVVRQVWAGLGDGYVDLTAYAPQEWATGVKRGIYLGLAHGVEDLDTQIRGSFAGAANADTTIRPELTFTYTV